MSSYNYYKLLFQFYEIQLFSQSYQEKKKKVGIRAKENGYNEMGIQNMSLQRLYDSCLLLCIAIPCMFWKQKADLHSPLTMEGMSGITCCPGKLLKRDPRHPPGSTLWQSTLSTAYFILTCGNMNLRNRKVIVPNKFSIYFQVS